MLNAAPLIGPFRNYPEELGKLLRVVDIEDFGRESAPIPNLPAEWRWIVELGRAGALRGAPEADAIIRGALDHIECSEDRICLLVNYLLRDRFPEKAHALYLGEVIDFYEAQGSNGLRGLSNQEERLALHFSAIELLVQVLGLRGRGECHRRLMRAYHHLIFSGKLAAVVREQALPGYYFSLRLAATAIRREPGSWLFLLPDAADGIAGLATSTTDAATHRILATADEVLRMLATHRDGA